MKEEQMAAGLLKVLQAKGVTALLMANRPQNPAPHKDNTGREFYVLEWEGVRIGVPVVYYRFLTSTTSIKAIAFLFVCYTEQRKNSHTVVDSDRFAAICGMKSKRRAAQYLLDVVAALSKVSMQWWEKVRMPGKKGKHMEKMTVESVCSFCTAEGRKKSLRFVCLSHDLIEYLKGGAFLTLCESLFLLDGKKCPWGFPVGLRLVSHYTMNKRKGHKNAECISVKSLLKGAGCLSEITAAAIMKRDKHWQRRVRARLVNALNVLRDIGVITYWCFDGDETTLKGLLSCYVRFKVNPALFGGQIPLAC